MAANGYLVNTDVTVTWDGVSVRLMRGTVIDSPASGALVTALGSNITALTASQQAAANGVTLTPLENLTGGGKTPYSWGQN